MHVITRKRLNDFVQKHPDSLHALDRWYRLVKKLTFKTFADVRIAFPSADKVGEYTVFNVGGNKIRLITVIHYNRQKLYIRAVLNHEEYDENRWKS